MILPALDGVVDRLTAGARVADVGCGSGVALVSLAAAFPASGSRGSTRPGMRSTGPGPGWPGTGGSTSDFRVAGAEDLPPDSRYDLIVTLDCIHDLPRPAEAMAAIRRAIRPTAPG